MSLIRGPFTIKWGANTLLDIEELNVDFAIGSDDYVNIKGKTFELDGATKFGITLTLLATDIASLAALLPQHYVAQGGVLSTGETVNNAAGAIDAVPHKCDESLLYNDLDIINCADTTQVTRLVNARTKWGGFDITNKLQKIMVRFIGEADARQAPFQILHPTSAGNFLLLSDTDYLLLDDSGSRMIL